MKIREYISVMDDISGKPYLVEEKGIEVPDGTKIFSPKPIVSFMNQNYMMNKLTDERAYVIAYDNTGNVSGVFLAGKGSVNGSIVSPHSILLNTLLLNASNIVLIHNHPSGDLKPSQADIRFSRHLKKAAKLLEINLLDSIVIGRNDYYSMNSNGGIK